MEAYIIKASKPEQNSWRIWNKCFSNNMLLFWIKFHWNVLKWDQWTLGQYWLRYWVDAKQTTIIFKPMLTEFTWAYVPHWASVLTKPNKWVIHASNPHVPNIPISNAQHYGRLSYFTHSSMCFLGVIHNETWEYICLSQHWGGAGSWNNISWKERTRSPNTINTTLLMLWQHKEPMRLQPWYWLSCLRILRFPVPQYLSLTNPSVLDQVRLISIQAPRVQYHICPMWVTTLFNVCLHVYYLMFL